MGRYMESCKAAVLDGPGKEGSLGWARRISVTKDVGRISQLQSLDPDFCH